MTPLLDETLADWYVRAVGWDGRAVIDGTAEEPEIWITHADGDTYALCWYLREAIGFAKGHERAEDVIQRAKKGALLAKPRQWAA